MKVFLKRLSLFAIFLVSLDLSVGILCQSLTKNAKGGDTARNEYIANRLDAPLLFFGSSRAIHHYDPKIFSDTLCMKSYNCGQDGMGIIMFYARYKMLTERYVPRLIVYDVLPGFDFEKNDNYGYLTWLKPYYDKEGIDSIFWRIAPVERYKMLSQMYRYNGKILQMVGDNFANIREDASGYRPIYAVMSYEPHGQENGAHIEVDEIKMYYWHRFIADCKKNGTRLVFAMSPFYGGSPVVRKQYAPMYDLARRYGIPVLCHFADDDIVHRKDLFMDTYHMNHKGAEMYSKRLASEILRNYY